MVEPERLRTFVAIELPAPHKEALARLQDQLRRPGDGVRWVHPDSLHLTLKFLGNVARSRIQSLVEALTPVAQEGTAFSLNLGALGAFPTLDRPRVLWIGLFGDLAQLTALQRRIEAALAPLGFPAEERPFTPHLTLGRAPASRTARGLPSWETLLRSTAPPPTPPIAVEAFALMSSTLTPSGAIYRRLALFPLSGTVAKAAE
jgi:2'-5' RNA ligase